MTGPCSHPRCESSGNGLESRLFAVLPENSRKTHSLLEFRFQRSGMRFVTGLGRDEIGGGFILDGVGRAKCATFVHNENG
ncbi:hypothetical protein DVH24_006296 [Malus domestica]|uniref:Uncharacterized protein n=1 Tax=Malus domestica TaxID=3750 RepID=A0A498K9T0_MALDO|nr:hypothetical protein DVH24_006296 [Malus domestica]